MDLNKLIDANDFDSFIRRASDQTIDALVRMCLDGKKFSSKESIDNEIKDMIIGESKSRQES